MIYQHPLNLKEKIMDIRLNQTEIEKAIRQYVGEQGISLRNKTLGIVFTSGRKENGLIADLTITESEIPGFDDALKAVMTRSQPIVDTTSDADVTKIPAAVVVAKEEAVAVADKAKPATTKSIAAAAMAAPLEDEPVGAGAPVEEEEAKPAAATTSLFGN